MIREGAAILLHLLDFFVQSYMVSPADFLLAVYARWNASLPTPMHLGANTERLVEPVTGRPAFQQALAAESPGAATWTS